MGTALALVLAIAMPAWAFWTVKTTVGSAGAAAATTVQAGQQPSIAVDGDDVTLTWGATTLANSEAVEGYEIRRYDESDLTQQTVLTTCDGLQTSLTCTEQAVPDGTWLYTVTPRVGDHWTGDESNPSDPVLVDTAAPVNELTLTDITGGASLQSSTLYYRGLESGSLRIRNGVADGGSGPASSATSALSGGATGFTHSPSAVSSPAGGPYDSAPFTWSAGTTSAPQVTVTGADVAGNTAISTVAFSNDSTPPAPGSISYGTEPSGGEISITHAAGVDSGSGVASRQLQRRFAPYDGTTCGSWTSWIDRGPANPASPYSDPVGAGACYQYRLRATDRVGNTETTTGADIVTAKSYADQVSDTAGLQSWWRLGEAGAGTAVDSTSDNDGTYFGGPTYGVTGALTSDPNTAVGFDGVDDYVRAERRIANDFSIELWFNSTQGMGTDPDWRDGAGLVDAYGGLSRRDFGISLLADGAIAAGTGGSIFPLFPLFSDVSIVSSVDGLNDGAWHHVVFTRTKSDGQMRLYVDGVQTASGIGSTAALDASTNLSFGRSQSGGNYYEGALDEIATYVTVMDAATVAKHYALASAATQDTTPPSGGSVGVTGLVGTGQSYSVTTTVSVAFDPGTDASGIASEGLGLERRTAPMTSGSCGSYGSWEIMATDPVSPYTDELDDGACYGYRYTVYDTEGNRARYTSSAIKVDTTAPAPPALTLTGVNNAYAEDASTVFYRSAASSGSFEVGASATDAESGIAGYTWTYPGSGWTRTGTGSSRVYSWSGTPSGNSAGVTASNNASLTSPASSFSLVADNTPPDGGSVSYLDGATAADTAEVAFAAGTDSQSGILTRTIEVRVAAAPGQTCGAYGTWSVVQSDPATSPVTVSLTEDSCHEFRVQEVDNVGNIRTYTSAAVLINAPGYDEVVAATPDLLGWWRLGEPSAGAEFSRDSFSTGSSGTLLENRSGELGASWTKHTASGSNPMRITPGGRVRKDGTDTLRALYYASAVPPSANYSVSAQVTRQSIVDKDSIGVAGRISTSQDTFYSLQFQAKDRRWVLARIRNGHTTRSKTSNSLIRQTLRSRSLWR